MSAKKGLVFLLLLSLIFLYGCTQGTSSSSGVVGAYANCNGDDSQMVTASFAAYAPSSSESSPYQPGEEIDVEVQLTNKHSEEIPAGNLKVRLTGDASIASIFSGASVVSADTIYAIDADTCLDDTTEVEIGPLVYEGETTTKISKDITGLYCYTQDVDVKAFLYFTAEESEIGTTLPSGSNPPSSVQVTAIDQDPVDVDPGEDGTLRFKITLENVGDGTIVESMDECFEYRESSYREEFSLSVSTAYDVDCPDDVKLSREEGSDVITCTVDGIDTTNLGPNPSEITITLSGFAYEDEIPSTEVWIEP